MTKAYQHILTRFSHYGDYVLSSRVRVVWIGLSFVTTRFPQGLGTDLKTLKNLCRDYPKALDAIDRACKREPGGDQRSEQAKAIIVDNINIESRPDGTSREAGLRRLRKDRPDLHEQVLEGKKSVHAACVEAE
jgi:hypothetical protein